MTATPLKLNPPFSVISGELHLSAPKSSDSLLLQRRFSRLPRRIAISEGPKCAMSLRPQIAIANTYEPQKLTENRKKTQIFAETGLSH